MDQGRAVQILLSGRGVVKFAQGGGEMWEGACGFSPKMMKKMMKLKISKTKLEILKEYFGFLHLLWTGQGPQGWGSFGKFEKNPI